MTADMASLGQQCAHSSLAPSMSASSGRHVLHECASAGSQLHSCTAWPAMPNSRHDKATSTTASTSPTHGGHCDMIICRAWLSLLSCRVPPPHRQQHSCLPPSSLALAPSHGSMAASISLLPAPGSVACPASDRPLHSCPPHGSTAAHPPTCCPLLSPAPPQRHQRPGSTCRPS
jgi:hypothetical protein